MKLASRCGGRDGQLMLVSRDLRYWLSAAPIAATLQAALDDWERCAPELQALSDCLNAGEVVAEPFDVRDCLAPLPRAYQWADGSAYVNHVALVRRARGAELPESFWREPLIYQGGSDGFLGPTAPIRLPAEARAWGVDFEAEVAVITGEVPLGAGEDEAAAQIRLLMLVNDVSLRQLIPEELAKGFGFFQSKPASAFSPIALSPDELGPAWRNARVHRPLCSWLNGAPFGRPEAGVDMTFNFAQLIAHAARTRALAAGSIIGSGTVSNREGEGPGRPVVEGGLGYSCIAEQRCVEQLRHGQARTSFLSHGDRVRIGMWSEVGENLFGCIDQVCEFRDQG